MSNYPLEVDDTLGPDDAATSSVEYLAAAWKAAIRRAEAAEAEVRRLREIVSSVHGGSDIGDLLAGKRWDGGGDK